jgi:hypothetical protein
MRNLKYGVIALTPLLGAGGFAQGLNLGMNDGLIAQAQSPSQSYDAANGGKTPETDRQPDANRAGTTMGEVIRPQAPVPGTGDLKTAPRAQAKKQARAQARKGEKKTRDTRTSVRTYD